MRGRDRELRDSPFGEEQRSRTVAAVLYRVYDRLTLPFTIYFLLSSPLVRPEYRMTTWRKLRLGFRMYRNTGRVFTGISYRAHLFMAAKLLELPSTARGVVVECGCFRGGTTANLSLICDIVDRELFVYDSFEGLPPAEQGDKYANENTEGFLAAGLEQVKSHVERHGAPERCTFVKGFFADTLPGHTRPIVLAFLDVDLQSSMHDCLINLWPRLVPNGFLFIDEYVFPDYCAVFYSERYWRDYFDTTPPGLIGAGSGVGTGAIWTERVGQPRVTLGPASIAYTRKNLSGHWEYFPEPPAPPPDSGG